ncbi:MAG: LacI family DNA-binding transcriptional regulator [Opitutales bacterium]
MPDTSPRETITSLAKRLNLHHSTISRALRNDPSISEKTRKRVWETAAEVGYRPDPKIRELMHQVRKSRESTEPQETLAIFLPSSLELNPHRAKLIAYVQRGMEAEAESNGFTLEVHHEKAEGPSGHRISQVLYHRGVRGLIVMPPDDETYQPQLNFDHFATVAIGLDTLRTLPLHRVCFDAFLCMDECLHELSRRGHERVALVLSGIPFWCASARYQAASLLAAKRRGVTIQIFEEFNPDATEDYFRTVTSWRPDAILADTPFRLKGFSVAPFPVESGLQRYAIGMPEGRFSGYAIDLEEIGRLAIQRLILELQNNRIGLPDTPDSTLVTGRWMDSSDN